MNEALLHAADLHFRGHLLTVMPFQEGLVEAMCAWPKPPLELAAVLEDIGQRYMSLAAMLNEALVRTGRLAEEPEADDTTDARLDVFVRDLVAAAGAVTFGDGTCVDGSEALGNFRFVDGAIRAAVLLARPGRSEAS